MTTLSEIIKTTEDEAAKLRSKNMKRLCAEVKDNMTVGRILPDVISYEDPDSIRTAQSALTMIENRLDRIIAIQHDCKITIQSISKVENMVIRALVIASEIPKNASGPMQHRILITRVPTLTNVKSEWSMLSDLCAQAQSRMGAAIKTIKMQLELDSNLRWAQHRPPG